MCVCCLLGSSCPVCIIIRADGDLCWIVLANRTSLFFLSSGLLLSARRGTEREECENWEYVWTNHSVKMPHSSFFLGEEAKWVSVILGVAWHATVLAALAWLWAEVLKKELGCLCRSCYVRVRRLLSGLWRDSRSFCTAWHSHCCRGPATARTHARAQWWSVTVRVCVSEEREWIRDRPKWMIRGGF